MRPTTAKDVTINLYWSLRGASQLLIPRYTPAKWWECDMWRLTNADFVDEYEIKMSVADFRADVKKEKTGRYEIDPTTRRYAQLPNISKHDLLATDERGPNRFWFVIPAEMESAVEIPPYAGLLVFSPHSHPVLRKQAPKRHARKWDGNKARLFETFYHRFWTHETKTKEDVAPSCEPIEGLDPEEAVEESQATLL